ncbi:MAG TPA: protein phosphatase 2C domain-containing protein, partial [Candidatus Baltobacteraceae bacterium]|nr:protein phosphatase 2C domain-containing protein [Candidatus Baltobacteraceae bacterium]
MTKKPPRKRSPSLKWSGWTNRGKVRPNNEDSFLGLQFDAKEVFRLGKSGEASQEKMDYVFAVSDGMGGAQAGEFASSIAVEKITTLLPRAFQHSALGLQPGFSDVLAELFDQIHRSLVFVGGSYEETEGMQTTLSLCWLTPGWMYFGHIGDSRIYHLPKRKKTIKQLTHDDTHVGWLLRTGQINEREARMHPRRNFLQKALGGGNQFVDPQVGAIACGRGDIFLLCTDGLVDGLYDSQLAELLREFQSSKKSNLAQLLVETSVNNSGRDNTTA